MDSVLTKKPDCLTCKHSIGVDTKTADVLRQKNGYTKGEHFPKDFGLVCVERRITNPKPCKGYECL